MDHSYNDDWQMHQQPYEYGPLDDTASMYDKDAAVPGPSAAVGATTAAPEGEQGYARLLIDALGEEATRAMIADLLPYIVDQPAMPTPLPCMSATATLQHDDVATDPDVLQADNESMSMDATQTMDDAVPLSALTESMPGLSVDTSSSGSLAASESPLPVIPAGDAQGQAASLSPSHDSISTEPESHSERSMPAAKTNGKRGTKRARAPDNEHAPSTKQVKKRKTRRGRGAATQTSDTVTGDDLSDSGATADSSADVQASLISKDNDQDDHAGTDTATTVQPAQKVGKKNRKASKNSAGAGPGSKVQSKNKVKSRPARAIESYANDIERKKAALRIALRILNQQAVAELPKALPSKLAGEVAQAIQDLVDAQPNVPRSGDGEWVECDSCREEYGILECVEKAQQSDHKHDCHSVDACVVCGCPVVRGDIVQWRKHRKAKCGPWRAMVKRDWHIEWLESNGLLDAGSKIYHKQFFDHDLRKAADAVGDSAARRTLLLNALKAKELAKLPAAVHSNEPFKGMIAKKALEALQREVASESAAA